MPRRRPPTIATSKEILSTGNRASHPDSPSFRRSSPTYHKFTYESFLERLSEEHSQKKEIAFHPLFKIKLRDLPIAEAREDDDYSMSLHTPSAFAEESEQSSDSNLTSFNVAPDLRMSLVRIKRTLSPRIITVGRMMRGNKETISFRLRRFKSVRRALFDFIKVRL